MPVPDSSIFFFFDRMKTHINTCSAHSEHMVFIWSARSCISLVCQIIWFAKSSAPSPTRSSDVAQYITSPQGARTRIILACDTRKIEDVVARYISRYGRTLLFHKLALTTQKTFGAIIADVLTMTRCTSKVQRDAQQIPIRPKPSNMWASKSYKTII